MHRYSLTAATAGLVAGFGLFSSTALAHIELQSPLNRYSDIKSGDNKSCPCGSGTANRSCDKPDERSDDNRSTDRATTFAPGDTITVRFDEYVGHSGRFRVAFDPDGADLADFNQHILLDEPDPVGNTGNMGDGSIWEFQVKLPDVTCDNCTLQLIQVMDGDMVDPVADPMTRGGTYFQCADLVLADGTPAGGIPPANPSDHTGQDLGRNPPPGGAAGATGAGSSSMTVSSNTPSSSATSPTSMMADTTSASSNAAASMSAPRDATTGLETGKATSNMDSSDSGGCSLTIARSQRPGPALMAVAGLALGAAWRARRSKRR